MPRRALVVDDDFFFVEFLGELLEKRGYQVTKAYDGKEGLLALEKGPFDILFADLIMPKIDGIELIKIARRKFPDIAFQTIAVSGSVVEQMDQLKDAEDKTQKLTDEHTKLIDDILKHKEHEIMEV